MSARSDRRALIGALGACIAAGAIGAAAGSRTARAAAETAEATIDDNRILELCAEFETIERYRLSLFHGPNAVTDDARDTLIEPLAEKQEAIVDQLATLDASSVAALGAVARALILWEGDMLDDPSDPGECVNRRLSAWLALQAAAMSERKA